MMQQERVVLYDVPPLYDLVVHPGPCEAFYRELASQVGDPVLDLACGTGRLTIPLARDGHEVVGLDASPAMLSAARCKAVEDGPVDLTFVEGNMRSFDLGRRFPLVIVSCNSLAHLTSNEELRDCFSRIHHHLDPGGLLAFDIVNPDVGTLARSHTEAVRLDIGPNPSAGIAVEEIAVYDPIQQVRVATWRIHEPGIQVREVAPLRLSQIFPQEVPMLLEAGGLGLVARYGDFSRTPLTGASLNQICLARPAATLGERRSACQRLALKQTSASRPTDGVLRTPSPQSSETGQNSWGGLWKPA
jgi:SAM-dependent methyltransferase